LKTNEIRKNFLDFFRKKGHKIFPSDSLVPDDPTVLFTSAGMNQFKPYFLGQKRDISRAASCQKCLRATDLEEVGRTSYHHTFFEMLGNFSFGDYFKKEAIEFAWEFVTQHLKIEEKDLWVSVYKDDEEAYGVWKKHIGITEDKIVRLGEDKNFWPANAPRLGPNGPCGPCSEIFFDQGKSIGCKNNNCSPACDCGRFIEFWNLVFTQFNRLAENKLEPLPFKNIDTGMGLERIAAVMQGKESNFDIDILAPVVKFVKELVTKKELKTPALINAIVDHSRAVTFSIADGVFPSNEERGYVVRKLIRHALWKGNLLGIDNPFLHKTPSLYAEIMKEPYPELIDKKENISQIILAEEEKFIYTLKEGRSQFKVITEGLRKEKRDILSGEELFRLYDTYGFPLELSKELAQNYNFKVDENGFLNLFKKQQELSRKKSMFDENIFLTKEISFNENTLFLGYEYLDTEADILRLLKEGKDAEALIKDEEAAIILNRTPFFPESGGQLADKGKIKTDTGEFEVFSVFKVNEAIVHKGRVSRGEIHKGKAFVSVDKERRKALMRSHTATHLLQSALRKVLGEHVTQQGSLVDEDRLRFDFTHLKGLTAAELENVEDFVNESILNGDEVKKRMLSLGEAKEEGALAFFKDKYKEEVRVVSISNYSKELCGGTHLDNTSEIGTFVILSESSISSGIRRIEAIVGKEAYKYFKNLKNNSEELAGFIKCKTEDLKFSLEKILEDLKKEKEKTVNLEKEMLSLKIKEIIETKKEINGINFLAYSFSEKDYPILLYLADLLKDKFTSLFIFLVSSFSQKDIFICSASDDLVKKGFTPKKFSLLFQEELFLKGGGRDGLVQGVVLKKEKNLLSKVENCFIKFLNQ
jgi:alanyl-tRNA synthetase